MFWLWHFAFCTRIVLSGTILVSTWSKINVTAHKFHDMKVLKGRHFSQFSLTWEICRHCLSFNKPFPSHDKKTATDLMRQKFSEKVFWLSAACGCTFRFRHQGFIFCQLSFFGMFLLSVSRSTFLYGQKAQGVGRLGSWYLQTANSHEIFMTHLGQTELTRLNFRSFLSRNHWYALLPTLLGCAWV